MDSILTSIKRLLGIEEGYVQFDPELIIHINSVFTVLTQLGVGPTEGYFIEDKTNTWDEFISEDRKDLEAVKSYMFMKVKLIFDPPDRSAVLESYKAQIAEFEWRMNVAAESVKTE